jgi:hypothetical protein
MAVLATCLIGNFAWMSHSAFKIEMKFSAGAVSRAGPVHPMGRGDVALLQSLP